MLLISPGSVKKYTGNDADKMITQVDLGKYYLDPRF